MVASLRKFDAERVLVIGTGITVCIATIPPRAKLLRRALWSVLQQALQPESIVIEVDKFHEGAVATKNRALNKVTSTWVAWLDDDDYFLPDHLSTLYDAYLRNQDADVLYAWPEMDGAGDPSPQWFGVPFNAEALKIQSYVHTTALFRARMAQEVGGFATVRSSDGLMLDDWGLWLRMVDAGAHFVHVPKRTWVWNVNGQNTSGDPKRW